PMTTTWPMPAAVAPLPGVSRSITPTDAPATASSRAQAAPTIPAPMISTSNDCLTANAPLKRVALVQDEMAFECDERHTGDAGQHLIVFKCVARFEAAAHDALLHPCVAWSELAIRGEASQLGASSRATRRAIIRLAGA